MQEEYDPTKSGAPMDGREGLVLFFKVGNQLFGVRLTDVSHIEPFLQAEGGQEGVIVRGKGPEGGTVPVVNLHKFLGIEVAGKEKERTLILFREGESRFGLLADEVDKIVPGHQIRELTYPSLLGEDGRKVYGGFFSRDNRLVLALNPDFIWSSAESDADKDGACGNDS